MRSVRNSPRLPPAPNLRGSRRPGRLQPAWNANCFGEKLYGAKWRNFEMLLVDLAEAEAPLLALSVPRVYDLLTNPKELLELNIASTHLWVMRPISKMISDYQASLKQHPPIPVGTSDPYMPPGQSA